MKRILSIVAASLALCFGWEAAAQTDFYEVVPKHEFTINGFGGISTLQYKVPAPYGFQLEAKEAGDILSGYSVSTNLFDLGSLAGGGGLGWNIHFSPHWGLMLGADFAMYRSGISFPAAGNNIRYGLITGYLTYDDATKEEALVMARLFNFQETQTLYAVQIPLMVKFMTGIGARKANQFYIAAGAKLGINVSSSYRQSFNGISYFNDRGWQGSANSIFRYTADPTQGPGNSPVDPLTDLNPSSPDVWHDGSNFGRFDKNMAGQFQPQTPTGTAVDPTGAGGEPNNPEDYYDLTTETGVDGAPRITGVATKGNPAISNIARLNAIAAAEIGFRWALGNGWGLYTGLYLDYGFLPQTNQTDNVSVVDITKGTHSNPNSVLAASKLPLVIPPSSDNDPARFEKRSGNIVEKVNTFAAGLKLRLAFGAVKKKPVEPVIIVVRDTVTQTNTVVVRDTVTQTNTVVVRDTVTNTVVVRDTVTIIKEIPVEIQQTMMDLRNTMFDFDKDVIKEAAKEPLNKVVAWLQEHPKVKVEISGHTDNKGSDKYNQDLSERRARAVYNYFISQGVDKFRLAYAGYGKTRPIATNDTEEGRQMNRRVELNVIE